MKIFRKIFAFSFLLLSFIQINAQSGWTADLRVDHENYIGGIGNKEINVSMAVVLYDNNHNIVAPQSNYKYEFYRKYILEQNPQWIEYSTSPKWGINTTGTHTYQDSTIIPEGKFQVKCKITLPGGTIVNSDIITIPWYSVLPNQKKSSGTSFGTVHYWYKGGFRDNNGLGAIYIPRYDSKVLEAEANVVNSEKYNYWKRDNSDIFYNNFVKFSTAVLLNTTMTSQFNYTKNATVRAKVENLYLDVIKFEDPWVRDFNESPFGIRNQGLSAQPKYLENVNNNLGTNTNHQGVLLNQPTISGKPYYQISIDPTIIINGKQHKLYSKGWDVTNAQIQYPNKFTTGVVFTNDNAVVTANLKGSLLSNSVNAFANSGQHKVLTTQNGTMYLTYESMNSVWLEKSTDNGTTWQLMNNGNLNRAYFSGKSPSLLLDEDAGSENNIYIVYQEYDELEAYLQIAYFKDGNIVPEFNSKISSTSILLYNNAIDFQPVIAKTDYSKILLVYKLSSAVTSNPGLYYYLGGHNNNEAPAPTDITWDGTPQQVGNTTNNSSNPAMAVKKIFPKSSFYLTWQEGNTKINYTELIKSKIGTTWSIIQSGYTVISSGSGYTTNEAPTITMYNENPHVNWIGIKTISSGKWWGETQPTTTYRQVVKRGISLAGSWGIFYETGNNVINTSSNSTTNGDYVIAWVEENTPGSYVDKVVKNISSNKTFSYLGTTAKYLQLGNGATTNNMYATTFKTTSLPYPFEQSADIGSKVLKGGIIASGRQGVVYRENAEFYFAIGDVYLGRDLVEFTEVVDTTYVNDLVHLNSYLQTEAFDINNNSSVTYSVLYGLTDSLKAAETLQPGDDVNFKVELIDAQTENVIGAYDEITYTKNSLNNYNNIAYVINTEGIGSRTVKLRLVVNDNLNGGYGFSKIYGEDNVLGKFNNPVEQNYQGSMEVKQFALTQNYPNPFNPSTQIKYEIPKEGYVTLKVYDILGREVVTLVNQKQSVGRYEATFSTTGVSSQISSGVYIYRLTVRSGLVGSFAASKKMILLK